MEKGDKMDDLDKGLAIALRFLSNRMKTEEEVRRKLNAKDYGHLNEEIIATLKRMNYIDDENYIACYIRDRINFNPMGRLRIRKELERRGIDKTLIENNVEYKSIDELSLIIGLLDTKLSNYDLKDKRDLKKVFGYLARRGFEYENINSALRQRPQFPANLT